MIIQMDDHFFRDDVINYRYMYQSLMEDQAWKQIKVIKKDAPPPESLNRQELNKELL